MYANNKWKKKSVKKECLTLITTSQNRRCFRIVLNDCRNVALNVVSVNLRNPQSSMASSIKKIITKKNKKINKTYYS